MGDGLPTNREVAAALDLYGDLVEIEGAVRHRVLAYRRGAARVRSAPAPVAELALAGRAVELPDIGTTLQDKIAELARTGRIAALERLKERVPPGLADVARLREIGPRRARALWDEAGVSDLDSLRAALADGRVAAVPGMGPKTVVNLTEQLEAAAKAAADPGEGPAERVPLGQALPFAEDLAARLEAATGDRAVVAGSLRRGAEDAKDVDLAVCTDDPEAAAEALVADPMTAVVESRGPARTVVATHAGMRVEMRTSPPEAFGNLLQHITGSAAHNVRLREAARREGLSVSEHGITGPDGTLVTHPDEEGVYRALGLDWVPPEMREDRGEVEMARAGTLPRLVERRDLLGDLHVHTDWSDGRESLTAMVDAARRRGYRYVGIADHSRSLAMAGGLDPERVMRQWEAIARENARQHDVRVLRCTEVDILADGRLDFDDDLLAGFDFVTASVHSALAQPRERITARLLAACDNPHVDAIGHPTGRMLGRRPSSDIDLDALFARAAATGTLLEVNGQPHRLDLDAHMARRALEAGVRLVIGSDAHSGDGLDLVRYGVLVARRAGARAADVRNTYPFEAA